MWLSIQHTADAWSQPEYDAGMCGLLKYSKQYADAKEEN
jgi:hypothetical protein